ncbi:unnamed protein product [Clavelina lepadiformis]|uniref:Tyrosine--tRNA ligase n=1 Tax=Clavelina lepadiformis TaxID=159417 RepID=A0ABP0FCN4_CLALP
MVYHCCHSWLHLLRNTSQVAVRHLSTNNSTFSKENVLPKNILHLHERGMFQDIYPPASVNLPNLLKKKQCFYCGFDPTASSLHVGNLLSLMALLQCQRAGHNVIAVIGTATARAGDPSAHTKDRSILSKKDLFANAHSISESLERIVKNHEKHLYDNRLKKILPGFKILFNHTWYEKENVIDFMGTVGRDFRIGPMLEKRYIKDRINSLEGLVLAEFVYQIFQAYDWKYLRENYNCCFQIGGSDQLGNINAGYELIKKRYKEELYGLLTPLVTTLRGEKLGKSAGNTVWLNPDKTSPFEFYQYFYRQPDKVVEQFLKYFTFIDLNQIEDIIEEHKKKPQLRKAQRILARNVCKIVHGEIGLISAERCSRVLYEGRIDDLEQLSDDEIAATFLGMNIIHGVLEPDTTVYDLVANIVEAIPQGTKGENIILGGGVRINGRIVDFPHQILLSDIHVLKNDLTLVTVGKVHHYVVRWKLPRIEHDEDDDDDKLPSV